MIEAGGLLARPGAEPARGPVAIEIADGRIAALHDRRETQAGGLLALPALTDAHDHGRGMRTLAYGAVDDALEVWISRLRLEPAVDPCLLATVAFARMAEGGICAANHCHNPRDPHRLVQEAEAVSRAARDVGVRVAFAVPIFDRNPVVYGDVQPVYDRLPPDDRAAMAAMAASRARPPEAQLAAVDAIAAFEHDLFAVQYCPVGPQWVSDATMARIADASAATGRRVHMHLFETRYQHEWANAAYDGGLLRHLDAIGLLSPRLTVAHGVWLTADECALLADRGVTVSVNPSSNLRLRSGIAPVGRYIEAGLRFGLGLDGMAFDDDEDALRELRLMWQLNRGFGVDGALSVERLFQAAMVDGPLTPARLFQAAMVDGRRTVVDDGGGVLEAGAPADVMLLDLAAMASDVMPGAADPVQVLLTRMTRRHLNGLVVAGRTVVAGGRCVTVDLPALEAELTAQARASWAAMPPDTGAADRLAAAIADYYRCGCHRPQAEAAQ